jgi:hypothetical protein
MSSSVNRYVRVALIVAAIAVVFVVVSKLNHWRKGVLPPRTVKKMRTLIKQAAHYASLSEQDQNPSYALLHSNTALNYFTVAQMLISERELQKLSGINTDQMKNYLLWQQEAALAKLSKQCPVSQPRDGLYPVSISK